MLRLKNKYAGERAAVVLGGPSLISLNFDYGRLNRAGFVVVAASKSLSPETMARGLQPDCFLMMFPESCKDNSLQSFALRSFCSGVDLGPYLKHRWRGVFAEIRDDFDRYLEKWRPHRGPHKRFRWKPGVYLKDSPLDVLLRHPEIKIVANGPLLDEHFPELESPHNIYRYEQSTEPEEFELDRHYTMIERDGTVLNRLSGMSSSTSIALYPILRFMGFSEVYLIDMDLNMIGSVEFAAPFTFKTMWHFKRFYKKTFRVFSSKQTLNRPVWLRPQHDFDDTKMLLNYDGMHIVRVFNPHRYVGSLDGVPSITFGQFQELLVAA